MYTQSLNTIEGTFSMTGLLVAMFSHQPVFVTLGSQYKTRLVLNNPSTGEEISEERESVAKNGHYECQYEISTMIRLLCDVDNALARLTYDGSPAPVGEFLSISLYAQVGAQWMSILEEDVDFAVLYASSDWNESITAGDVKARLWANFPQTTPCGTFGSSLVALETSMQYSVGVPSQYRSLLARMLHMDVTEFLDEEGDEFYADIMDGKDVSVKLSFVQRMADGQGSVANGTRTYHFRTDLTPWGKGVYLRWLQRDGSVGYWNFIKSKDILATGVDQSFSTFVDGLENAPVNGVYRNGAKQSFTLDRSIVIGTPHVTEDEYEYLLGLVGSPVVEMLVGGTKTTPKWARVNVATGTYTRECPKSGLSRLRDFELTIIPPKPSNARL